MIDYDKSVTDYTTTTRDNSVKTKYHLVNEKQTQIHQLDVQRNGSTVCH